MAWTNADGLYIRFGREEATLGTAGEYHNYGAQREVEVKIDLTGLALTSSILSDTVVIPSGAFIEEVAVLTTVAATGATAALNIGLVDQDRSTALDADGLVAALAVTAIDTAGETNVIRKGSTGAGALIGTTLTNAGLLVADYDTAAFTAGEVVVRIRYSVQ